MKLSKRLQAIYNMVNSPCILADIGCDHGLLPIALIEGEKCQKAYACDVRKGPLARAQEAIALHHLEDKITTVLCDGLDGVKEDVDTFVIAGMGFDTITHILTDGMAKAFKAKQLILQSNNHVEDLRRWLCDHGFTIDHEELVEEQHYYQILSVHYESEKLSEDQILFGKFLPSHPLFSKYWNYMLEKKKLILQNMPENHENREELISLIKCIEDKLKEVVDSKKN